MRSHPVAPQYCRLLACDLPEGQHLICTSRAYAPRHGPDVSGGLVGRITRQPGGAADGGAGEAEGAPVVERLGGEAGVEVERQAALSPGACGRLIAIDLVVRADGEQRGDVAFD